MSAASALRAAHAAGIQLRLDGDELVLAAAAPPAPAMIDILSRHKAGLMALLRPAEDGWAATDWLVLFEERAGVLEFGGGLPRAEAEAQAFTCCVLEWLNRHPAPSPAGRCAGCGKAGLPGAVLLPFGTESTHTWLHAECWPAWHRARREGAATALRKMGVNPL
jgi:hypothetical protein